MFILYKGKGDPLLPNSYRAIALLDSFVKVYERLLCHRVVTWASALEIIPAEQFGFRPGSSTLDAIFCFWKLIFYFVRIKQGVLFAALIDFKSAFPSVDRNLLFRKLSSLGMSRKFGVALHSLFEKNSFRLRLSGEVTELFPVTTGLREGSVLSPILFSIFISSLEQEVLGPFPVSKFLLRDCVFDGVIVNGLLFADDLVIFALSEQCLRARLKMLHAFVKNHKLTVNTSKCEIVPFGCKRFDSFEFKFNGQAIPVVGKCKYLGVFFDHLNLLEAQKVSLVAKFQNATGAFFRLARHIKMSDLRSWEILQNSLLFSILYGSEMLDGSALAIELEPIFRKAVRSYIGLPNQVSNALLCSLFPRFSFQGLLVKKKWGFLRRMSLPCPTLAPVFFVEDRISSFVAEQGFSADLRKELGAVGLEELVWTLDKNLASCALSHHQASQMQALWRDLASARSTRFLCVVFGEFDLWHEFLRHAADVNLASLRIALLAWSGSVGTTIAKKKISFCPFCGARLDGKHFFLCDQEPGHQLSLTAQARQRNFAPVLSRTYQVYFRFLFRLRPSIISLEEAEILSALDSER
jgi:hypothetical protein